MKPELLRTLGKLAAVGLLVILGMWGYFAWCVVVAAQEDETRPADCALVFGDLRREVALSGVTARLRHAVSLYRGHLVTGIILQDFRDLTSADQLVRNELRMVPTADVFCDARAPVAAEELGFVKTTMAARRWKTCLLCAEPYRMMTALEYVKGNGVEAYASPVREPPADLSWSHSVRVTLKEALKYALHN